MTRVKTGIIRRRKHKKILNAAKGFSGARRRLIKKAKETLLKSREYSFAGRKLKKRNFRQLWIIRINAALEGTGIKYSSFIKKLKDKGITLDRKSLAMIAQSPKDFKELIDKVR